MGHRPRRAEGLRLPGQFGTPRNSRGQLEMIDSRLHKDSLYFTFLCLQCEEPKGWLQSCYDDVNRLANINYHRACQLSANVNVCACCNLINTLIFYL